MGGREAAGDEGEGIRKRGKDIDEKMIEFIFLVIVDPVIWAWAWAWDWIGRVGGGSEESRSACPRYPSPSVR